ncbi:hypothetical protein LZ554_007417 [Drepanopeziza brunnea f. sp. 'monogermtubi']|nr:hypothetical protein LZ554_007417 [Drepanopeziza brunnea f. sp. 'monogermtubi']
MSNLENNPLFLSYPIPSQHQHYPTDSCALTFTSTVTITGRLPLSVFSQPFPPDPEGLLDFRLLSSSTTNLHK